MKIDWDQRFMDLAAHVSLWSKDPSTKVGAVIVNSDKLVLSLGYNGFPRGVLDLEERYKDRPTKYLFVAHAERNALDNSYGDMRGATLYTTLCPCNECTKSIIQKGIKKVVSKKFDNGRNALSTLISDNNFNVSLEMMSEADIEFKLI